VKVWIDDQLVIDAWSNGAYREDSGSFNHPDGRVHRIRVDYYNVSGSGANDATLGLSLKQVGGFDWTNDWSGYLKPSYGLETSKKTYDTQLGDAVSTITYQDPAYGTIQNVNADPSGLNYQTNTTFETAGTGYFRQLSKTSPGGSTTQYQYYDALETKDNPCTTTVEALPQAGFLKSRVDADPDGAGSGASVKNETIYDKTGNPVASRLGNDAWTCTTYDDRARVAKVVIPTVGARVGRTVTYNYAANGNPLSTKITDGNGFTTTTIDLLGRTVKFRDTGGNITDTTYDNIGQVTQRIGKLGTESFAYDDYGRPTTYSLDAATLSSVSYDSNGKVSQVEYPSIKDPTTNQTLKLNAPQRDDMDRLTSIDYTLPNNQHISNNVSLSQSGMIIDESVNSVDLSPGVQGYSYDKAGRLMQALTGGHTYSYGFGSPNAACNSKTGNNSNTGKNSNRTTQTIDGVGSWYCYDMADRLIGASDAKLDAPTYDNHGNTLTLGTGSDTTTFLYDQGDRNTSIQQGSSLKVDYKRDHDDRIIQRQMTAGGTTSTYYYGSTGGPNYTFMYTDNTTKQVLEKYLTLPGGVTITLRPTETATANKSKISLRNIHGDTISVLNGEGTNETGILLYDPFGSKITPTAAYIASNPSVNFATNTATIDNVQGSQSAGWAAVARKTGESAFALQPVQMGARVYIPTLGRFLSVDPVEGGGPNNYAYVQDPINQQDYSGQFAFALAFPVVAFPPLWPVAIVAAAVVAGVVAGIAIHNYIASRSTPTANTSSQTNTGGSTNGRTPTNGGSPQSSGGGGRSSAPQPPKKPGGGVVKAIVKAIKLNGYKARVEIRTPEGLTKYDLKGESHYNKPNIGGPYAGKDVPTPHKKFIPNNPRNPNGGLGRPGPTVPFDPGDVEMIIKFLSGQ
jgi:RHS repeat-associated protein